MPSRFGSPGDNQGLKPGLRPSRKSYPWQKCTTPGCGLAFYSHRGKLKWCPACWPIVLDLRSSGVPKEDIPQLVFERRRLLADEWAAQMATKKYTSRG